MTPAEILLNAGKLLIIMGTVLFVAISVRAQLTYWQNDEKRNYPSMSKRNKLLFKFGKYEFYVLLGTIGLLLAIAAARLLWQMVTIGW